MLHDVKVELPQEREKEEEHKKGSSEVPPVTESNQNLQGTGNEIKGDTVKGKGWFAFRW